MATQVNAKGSGTRITPPGEGRLTSERVWRELARASFGVIGYATPSGEPRASGIVYRVVGKRLYLVVGGDSWKARHVAASGRVSMVVPVRRGGILSLVIPIPPATISFHAAATVHPAGSMDVRSLPKELLSLLPGERLEASCVVELVPEGAFSTYGVGVSLFGMRHPQLARARVAVS